jgi:hypothetical protein
MEELGLQDSEGMGLDPTINDNRGDKGRYLHNLQSHHDFLKICSFCVPPDTVLDEQHEIWLPYHTKKVCNHRINIFQEIAKDKAFKDLRKNLKVMLKMEAKIASFEMHDVTESTCQLSLSLSTKSINF